MSLPGETTSHELYNSSGDIKLDELLTDPILIAAAKEALDATEYTLKKLTTLSEIEALQMPSDQDTLNQPIVDGIVSGIVGEKSAGEVERI